MKRTVIAKLMTLILPLGLLSGAAHADLLLEPYVGYMPMGKIHYTGASEETLSGVIYGARVGYSNMLGLQLGVDYSTGALKDSDSPTTEYTPSNLAAFVGWDFPILLRVWAGLGLSSKFEAVNSGQTWTIEDGAKYMKVGVGFTPLPLISLNLEYVTTQHDLPAAIGTGTMSSNGLVLGASLPFDL